MFPVHEDITILDDVRLIRRISKEYLDYDKATGKPKLNPITGEFTSTSAAFQTPSKGRGNLSVDIEKLMLADNVDPADFVITGNFIAAVILTAGQVRHAELSIAKTPLDDNPYHGDVGSSEGGRISRSKSRELKENCVWLKKPQNI